MTAPATTKTRDPQPNRHTEQWPPDAPPAAITKHFSNPDDVRRGGQDNDPLERFRCRCVRCDRRGWLARVDEVAKASAKPRSRRSRRPVYASSWAEMLRAGLHPVTGQLLEDGERVA